MTKGCSRRTIVAAGVATAVWIALEWGIQPIIERSFAPGSVREVVTLSLRLLGYGAALATLLSLDARWTRAEDAPSPQDPLPRDPGE